MNRTRSRILLFELPLLIGGIIEATVEAAFDLAVVTSDEPLLSHAVLAAGADAVIIGFDDPQQVEPLLIRHPWLKLLAVVGHGKEAYLYELRPHREPLGELSAPSLLNALRPLGVIANHRDG